MCYYKDQIKKDVVGGPRHEQACDEYSIQIVAGMPKRQASRKSSESVAFNAAVTPGIVWTSHKSQPQTSKWLGRTRVALTSQKGP
jgi:hypothetical protein